MFDDYITLTQKYPNTFDNSDGELEIVLDKEKLVEEQENLYSIADAKKHPRHWYNLGVVAEDAWVVVLRDLVKFPDGKYGGYIRTINRKSQLEQSGKDVVILVKIDTKFLLIKHFRHEDRKWHWECPRGFGEQGLSPKENAIKEIEEETGLMVNSIQQLDNNAERVAYFLADCTGNIFNLDKSESISDILLVDKNRLKEMISNCEIDDMYTLRAYILAELNNLLK